MEYYALEKPFMEDIELNRLYEQVVARRREIARENGQILDSIDDLVCSEHPDATFEQMRIPGPSRGSKEKNLQIYRCGEDNNVKAYDCSECGIVVGNVRINTQSSSEVSPMRSSTRSGTLEGIQLYHCRICNIKLGQNS